MEESNEMPEHPTDVLTDNIMKFVGDLDCLYTTLPLLMSLMNIVRKETQKEFKTFIDERATDRSENGNRMTYVIQLDDIGKHDRLKRLHRNSVTAQVFIPRHFVTSLVSQYDSFLGCLVRFIFDAKPDALNASEKSISFTELQKFDSIEAARDHIIEKEVDTVIRKSPAEQFSWLKEKLGIPFNKDLQSWPVFVELNERRNLFVHCDGRVSSQYLKCCLEHKCSIDTKLASGDQLEVRAGLEKLDSDLSGMAALQ